MNLARILRLPNLILSIIKLLTNLEYIREFTRWFGFLSPGVRISYSLSQSFEDLLLLKILPSSGKYLDIGAHHPIRYSNTLALNKLGWRGVNIDANPNLLQDFEKFRPCDVNLCGAVGGKDSYQLTVFDEPLVSSVDKEFIDSAENAGYKKLSMIETKGFTLRSILEEYFIGGCDLLLIDIEGSELDAILSGDFKKIEPGLLPSYILLEEDRSLQAVLVSEETRYLNSAGYEILYLLPTAVCYRLVK